MCTRMHSVVLMLFLLSRALAPHSEWQHWPCHRPDSRHGTALLPFCPRHHSLHTAPLMPLTQPPEHWTPRLATASTPGAPAGSAGSGRRWPLVETAAAEISSSSAPPALPPPALPSGRSLFAGWSSLLCSQLGPCPPVPVLPATASSPEPCTPLAGVVGAESYQEFPQQQPVPLKLWASLGLLRLLQQGVRGHRQSQGCSLALQWCAVNGSPMVNGFLALAQSANIFPGGGGVASAPGWGAPRPRGPQ